MARNYKVTFGYITEDKTIWGKIPQTKIAHNDLELMFKIMSPFQWEGWMNSVNLLRRGGFTLITMTTFEDTNGHGLVNKVIRIER